MKYLTKNGVSESDLDWFRENACPPDVIGINHYPLSNRFLDHRMERYAPAYHGGNGKIQYADVGSFDWIGADEGIYPRYIGPDEILREVVERYNLPVAVTEAHIHGPREQQMQWLQDMHTAARTLKAEGAPIVAVTLWSLLGSFDWNSLCTSCKGFYESGVYDIRGPAPRPTGLAYMARSLAAGLDPDHPVLAKRGPWRKGSFAQTKAQVARPIVITGATGTLGRAFSRVANQRGLEHILMSRNEMDIADPASVRKALETTKPWAVINTAGFVRVDDAEAEFERARRENVLGSHILAEECKRLGIPLLAFSSDLVFDGSKIDQPYTEDDAPSPLNVYGKTKAEMESLVLEAHPHSMIIRTSSFFGPWDKHNFLVHALSALKKNESFRAPEDIVVSPTYVPDLVATSLDLLIDGLYGIVHLTNKGEISWAEFARRAASAFSLEPGLVAGEPGDKFQFRAPRPKYSALSSTRIRIMPELEDAIERFKSELNHEEVFQ